MITILKSKIHRATITDSNVDYEGSITISKDLMDKVGLFKYEKVLCSNIDNGNRFETYVIPGKKHAGEIILNGAASHLGKIGEKLTIMSFRTCDYSYDSSDRHIIVQKITLNNENKINERN